MVISVSFYKGLQTTATGPIATHHPVSIGSHEILQMKLNKLDTRICISAQFSSSTSPGTDSVSLMKKVKEKCTLIVYQQKQHNLQYSECVHGKPFNGSGIHLVFIKLNIGLYC